MKVHRTSRVVLAVVVAMLLHPGNVEAATGDSRKTVDAIEYRFTDTGPAIQAFRLVAADRGWTQYEIDSWVVAVRDIVGLESGGCWNLRRGAKLPRAGANCATVSGVSRHQDAGFGQVTKVWWGRRGPVCRQAGLCSAQAVTSSPYNSMLSLVVALEHDPSLRWSYCYNRHARSYHRIACNNRGASTV